METPMLEPQKTQLSQVNNGVTTEPCLIVLDAAEKRPDSQSAELEKNQFCLEVLNKKDYQDANDLVMLIDDSEDAAENGPDSRTAESEKNQFCSEVFNKKDYKDANDLETLIDDSEDVAEKGPDSQTAESEKNQFYSEVLNEKNYQDANDPVTLIDDSEDVAEKEPDSQIAESEKNQFCSEVLNKEDYRDANDLVTLTDDSEDSDSDSSDSAPHPETSHSSSESDDENNRTSKGKNQKNKIQENKQIYGDFGNLPPIENLHISVEEVRCEPVGEVSWFVEQIIVVKPKTGVPTLNLETMLFIERGKRALGRIFDVFGQVSEPYYCVRFNNPEQIKEYGIKQGMTVYFCPNSEYTSLIFMSELVKLKGLDGYNHPDEHPEFSDDEEERAYYASLKKKSNNKKTPRAGEIPNKRHKSETSTFRSPHPWNSYPQHSYNPPGYNSWFYQNRRNNFQPPHQRYNRIPEFNAFPNQPIMFQQPFLPYFGPQNLPPHPPP